MGINLVIAVTDDDWFEQLRQQPNLRRVCKSGGGAEGGVPAPLRS